MLIKFILTLLLFPPPPPLTHTHTPHTLLSHFWKQLNRRIQNKRIQKLHKKLFIYFNIFLNISRTSCCVLDIKLSSQWPKTGAPRKWWKLWYLSLRLRIRSELLFFVSMTVIIEAVFGELIDLGGVRKRGKKKEERGGYWKDEGIGWWEGKQTLPSLMKGSTCNTWAFISFNCLNNWEILDAFS